jgi:hypothetical protein
MTKEEDGAQRNNEEAEAARRGGEGGGSREVGPAGGWDGESPQSPRECSIATTQLQNAAPVAAPARYNARPIYIL